MFVGIHMSHLLKKIAFAAALFITMAQVPTNAEGLEALWTQYGVSDGVVKMSLHTDLDPLKPVPAKAELWLSPTRLRLAS